jgi:hypothetical protein
VTSRLGGAVVIVALALALAGCGGRSGLTSAEQGQLLGLIGKARTAAAAGNPSGAQTALGQLRARITRLRLAGELDPARAARMQSVAAQAQSAVRVLSAAATAPTVATPTPTPTPKAPGSAARPKLPAAPTDTPTQIVIQTADGLRNRVQQSVDKGVARLKDQLARLRDRLPGASGGN